MLRDHLHPTFAFDEREDVPIGGREIGRVAQIIAAPRIPGDDKDVDPLRRHRCGKPCAPFCAKGSRHGAHSSLMPPRSTIVL
jgi:hypothetical protein